MENKFNTFYNLHYKNCFNQIKEYTKYLENSVIIDIGSNIGLFAKGITELVKYKHIHLFEPSKEYFDKSKEILKDFSNITYNNLGLSNVNSTLDLYKSNDFNIGWNTFYKKDPNQDENFFEFMDKENVKVVKLDDYYREIDSIDFIKIDVEGYERYVLEGSWDLIKKFKPYILIEVSWGVNHPEWKLNQNLYNRLFSLGYKSIKFNNFTKDVFFEPLKKI